MPVDPLTRAIAQFVHNHPTHWQVDIVVDPEDPRPPLLVRQAAEVLRRLEKTGSDFPRQARFLVNGERWFQYEYDQLGWYDPKASCPAETEPSSKRLFRPIKSVGMLLDSLTTLLNSENLSYRLIPVPYGMLIDLDVLVQLDLIAVTRNLAQLAVSQRTGYRFEIWHDDGKIVEVENLGTKKWKYTAIPWAGDRTPISGKENRNGLHHYEHHRMVHRRGYHPHTPHLYREVLLQGGLPPIIESSLTWLSRA